MAELAVESEDEDEVLLAMAEEIGNLIAHVGGHEHVHHLLLPLETLCAPEEALVRDKVAAARACLRRCADAAAGSRVADQGRGSDSQCGGGVCAPHPQAGDGGLQLAQDRSCSAVCHCLQACLGLVKGGDEKVKFGWVTVRLFGQLSKDDFPMVRKAACTALGGFSQVVEQSNLQNEIIPLFTSLARDDQDSVRIVAVDNCVTLGRIFATDKNQSLV
eukprot:764873-Hanusia_phi.AAC.3